MGFRKWNQEGLFVPYKMRICAQESEDYRFFLL